MCDWCGKDITDLKYKKTAGAAEELEIWSTDQSRVYCVTGNHIFRVVGIFSP
jgi:hypothetical protein